jgi:hypothetical protein
VRASSLLLLLLSHKGKKEKKGKNFPQNFLFLVWRQRAATEREGRKNLNDFAVEWWRRPKAFVSTHPVVSFSFSWSSKRRKD